MIKHKPADCIDKIKSEPGLTESIFEIRPEPKVHECSI